jgi:alkylation response protein AidB-like acyl-CoA dehydrogenase
METAISNDVEMLREATARFAQSACPLSKVRELADTDRGVESKYWKEGAALGWFGMLVSEDWGGGSVSGDAIRELAIIAEERGRTLQPGPFIGTNVLAATVHRRGSEAVKRQVIPPIVEGAATGGWVVGDDLGPRAAGTRLIGRLAPGGMVLTGSATAVQAVGDVDWLVVSTGSSGMGAAQVLVPRGTPGVTVESKDSLDITQRFSDIDFDEVSLPSERILVQGDDAVSEAEYQLQIGLVLTMAETIGALDSLFEMTRVYSLDRIAFGRPIGSFQAVKHQLADMSLALEASKAVYWSAVDAVSRETPVSGEVCSIAKAWLSDAAIQIVQGCLQVFGGIGYTWEHDLHLYLRRITMNTVVLGDAEWHRERICCLHNL